MNTSPKLFADTEMKYLLTTSACSVLQGSFSICAELDPLELTQSEMFRLRSIRSQKQNRCVCFWCHALSFLGCRSGWENSMISLIDICYQSQTLDYLISSVIKPKRLRLFLGGGLKEQMRISVPAGASPLGVRDPVCSARALAR